MKLKDAREIAQDVVDSKTRSHVQAARDLALFVLAHADEIEKLREFYDRSADIAESTGYVLARGYLASLLERSGDNLTRASAISGIERHHLRDLLRKHGLRGT